MDRKFMEEALFEAKKCGKEEVPVGAVVVLNGKVVGRGRNTREADISVLGHAEINAIRDAEKTLKRWNLSDCEIYVTLEPCPMCAGAIINSKIKRVIFGAYEYKSGSFDSVVNLASLKYLSRPEVFCGIMENECSALVTEFFKNKR